MTFRSFTYFIGLGVHLLHFEVNVWKDNFIRVFHTREVVCARNESVWWDWGFISTYSLSQHVMNVSGELHVSVDLPAGKAPHYLLLRRKLVQKRSRRLPLENLFCYTNDTLRLESFLCDGVESCFYLYLMTFAPCSNFRNIFRMLMLDSRT